MAPDTEMLTKAVLVLMKRLGFPTLNFYDEDLEAIPSNASLEMFHDGDMKRTKFVMKTAEPILSVGEMQSEQPTTPQQMGFTGNLCGNCGSIEMVRNGTCEVCRACGTTSGGCS